MQREVHCPLCDYNLRLLTEPRCPECGYRFSWDEVLDERRRLHPCLFEHHPERNISSFVRTLTGSARPIRFWRSVHPTQLLSPNRLNLYALLISAIGIAAVGFYALTEFVLAEWMRPGLSARGMDVLGVYSSWLSPTLSTMILWPFSQFTISLLLALWVATSLAWTTLSIFILCSFRISMRRARIRPEHVFRCIAYTSDSIVWLGMLIILACLTAYLDHDFAGALDDMMYVVLLVGGPVSFLWTTFRLVSAYRIYLRFTHAIATVLVSQFIILLLLLIVLGYARW